MAALRTVNEMPGQHWPQSNRQCLVPAGRPALGARTIVRNLRNQAPAYNRAELSSRDFIRRGVACERSQVCKQSDVSVALPTNSFPVRGPKSIRPILKGAAAWGSRTKLAGPVKPDRSGLAADSKEAQSGDWASVHIRSSGVLNNDL